MSNENLDLVKNRAYYESCMAVPTTEIFFELFNEIKLEQMQISESKDVFHSTDKSGTAMIVSNTQTEDQK